jgi:hypothetical protein
VEVITFPVTAADDTNLGLNREFLNLSGGSHGLWDGPAMPLSIVTTLARLQDVQLMVQRQYIDVFVHTTHRQQCGADKSTVSLPETCAAQVFAAEGAHDSPADRVRSRCSRRAEQDLHIIGVEDGVEGADVLAVPVPDEGAQRVHPRPSAMARFLAC